MFTKLFLFFLHLNKANIYIGEFKEREKENSPKLISKQTLYENILQ